MNCGDCQENLSEYLDGGLAVERSEAIRVHLSLCAECSKLSEDLATILDSCTLDSLLENEPPNPAALWCRISNTIESEIKPEPAPEVREPRGFFSRVWNLSLAQAASAIVFIAILSSLLTIVGIRHYFAPPVDDLTSRSADSQTTFEKLLSKVGLADSPQAARERRLREQQAAIDYWNKRVQARRAMWDDNLRRGFDKNLKAIDQAMIEYQRSLEQNPDDELSGEMLDSVMNDKMNLLREFSEL